LRGVGQGGGAAAGAANGMERPIEPESSAAQAARLGEALRDARVARGLSLEDLAASLRIRRAHLAALEAGRVGDLPAQVYAVGFVRAYARALGLDEEEAVRRWREAAGATATRRAPELAFPAPVAERGLPGAATVLAGAAALVICVSLGWWLWSAGGGTPGTVDAVPRPPPPAEQPAARGSGGMAAVAVPGPSGAPGAQVPVQAAPPSAANAPPSPASPAQQPAAAPAGIARARGEGRILLRAPDVDVWIQVRERTADGPVVADRVLRPGEGWAVPARDGLLLSTGNAAALEVVVDGEPVPAALGPGPAVRRGVPLDPDRLKASSAAAPRRPAAR
jgi:transcriptional regulator with XRE-family HTH domain